MVSRREVQMRAREEKKCPWTEPWVKPQTKSGGHPTTCLVFMISISRLIWTSQLPVGCIAGINLSMGSANERRRYYVTPSVIGRTHTYTCYKRGLKPSSWFCLWCCYHWLHIHWITPVVKWQKAKDSSFFFRFCDQYSTKTKSDSPRWATTVTQPLRLQEKKRINIDCVLCAVFI